MAVASSTNKVNADPIEIEEHLPPFRVRPRFKFHSTQTPGAIAERIKTHLADENSECDGQFNSEYGTLYMPVKDQHYWSPRLNITLEADENGKTLIRGLYGPRPGVWTMFVFFYFVIAVAITFISIIGFSNISLDHSGSILWLVPVLLVIFATLWLVAYYGQRLGHDQMLTLHYFLEKSLGEPIDVHQ